MSDLVSLLLSKRGITTPEDIEKFLRPAYDRDTHDPFLLEGMTIAAARLLDGMEKNERIAVYADFDCDGIPGAAILSDFFRKVGYENFEVYLPHRDLEGYGLHTAAIEVLAARDVKVMITVDVGTNAVDAVRFAKEKGIDVIVTDHHEVTTRPEALAVLNPKLGEYPYRNLCGAAVAFKLVQATLRAGKERGHESFTKIVDGWDKWLLDLVAIATVADMVPLVGENRALAHFGLTVLRKSPRLGINALCSALRIKKSELSEGDIGFSIAPRINAASRMDEPSLALELLTTQNRDRAVMLAEKLEELNAKRKGIVSALVKEAKKNARARFSEGSKVVVLGNPDWKPALLGLAANSIMQERGGVVCLWGRDGNGKLKGSCRSDGTVSLVDIFEGARESFEECGGHKASGGFTVAQDKVHTLPEDLAKAHEKAAKIEKEEQDEHDALITVSEISSALFADINTLAPFGIGNPKPLFRIKSAIITDMKRFGKEKAHIELALECRTSGRRCRAFEFFRAPEDFSSPPAAGQSSELLATLERDSYRGGIALRLVDIMKQSVTI